MQSYWSNYSMTSFFLQTAFLGELFIFVHKSNTFFLMAASYSTIWQLHNLFNYFPIDRWKFRFFSFLFFFLIRDKATMDFLEYSSLHLDTKFFVGLFPQIGT